MPKAFPKEFRDDVVAVARKAEASVAQVAKDFGISESCLHRWLALADIQDGTRPGPTKEELQELRVNRPGFRGGSRPWKRGWSHGKQERVGEADTAAVLA